MNISGKRLATASLAAITLGLLGACAEQSSPDPEAATPTATSTPQPSPTPDEENMNPDITAEQITFVDELLAEPLPQDEATKRIEEAGYAWRLGTIDGEPQAVTMDYRTDRLTLTVDNGLVTDATWG